MTPPLLWLSISRSALAEAHDVCNCTRVAANVAKCSKDTSSSNGYNSRTWASTSYKGDEPALLAEATPAPSATAMLHALAKATTRHLAPSRTHNKTPYSLAAARWRALA